MPSIINIINGVDFANRLHRSHSVAAKARRLCVYAEQILMRGKSVKKTETIYLTNLEAKFRSDHPCER